MTRDGVLSQITDALAGAGKTAPKALLQALRDAAEYIEDHPEPKVTFDQPSTTVSHGGFGLLAAQCATELEEAAALKIGVMDSENKARAIEGQRLGAIQAVAARLREYA